MPNLQPNQEVFLGTLPGPIITQHQRKGNSTPHLAPNNAPCYNNNKL